VAASGKPFASNDTNQRSPFASRIVKPGANPACLGRTTDHLPGAGPVPASGPRTASSVDTGWARMRLVNQLESGTSSIVLMLRARDVGRGIAGPREEILGQVEHQIDVPLRDARRILRLRLPLERVVVVEFPAGPGRRRVSQDQHRDGDAGQGAKERWAAGHEQISWSRGWGQNAALPENTRCIPSRPLASSIRSGVASGL
jgi:hypothetical protein